MATGFHDGDCSNCDEKAIRLNSDNLCIACATSPLLIGEAQSAIADLKSLADDSTDPLGDICENAVDVIVAYEKLARDALDMQRDMRVELEYALETFRDTCQCGECGPCERQVAFDRVLEAEKKIWGRLQEATGKLT